MRLRAHDLRDGVRLRQHPFINAHDDLFDIDQVPAAVNEMVIIILDVLARVTRLEGVVLDLVTPALAHELASLFRVLRSEQFRHKFRITKP